MGEGVTDPNWLPAEPRRPLQPKPDAFGPEIGLPFDDISPDAKKRLVEGEWKDLDDEGNPKLD